VYVVVCPGVTVTLLPRTAPICGETMTYVALLTFHDSVTLLPAPLYAVAVKLAMPGTKPCGTLELV
jgi:hypothetical protein